MVKVGKTPMLRHRDPYKCYAVLVGVVGRCLEKSRVWGPWVVG